jgi:hypothetical protein
MGDGELVRSLSQTKAINSILCRVRDTTKKSSCVTTNNLLIANRLVALKT